MSSALNYVLPIEQLNHSDQIGKIKLSQVSCDTGNKGRIEDGCRRCDLIFIR